MPLNESCEECSTDPRGEQPITICDEPRCKYYSGYVCGAHHIHVDSDDNEITNE